MSAQIEARRLSGEHLGRTVTAPRHGFVRPVSGDLEYVGHQGGVTTLHVGPGRRYNVLLAPTDLVTIHD